MKAWEYLERLSAWPHRGSTSVYEREASRWIARTLEAMGYRVRIQPLLAPAATLYAGPPLVGLAVAGAAGVAVWLDATWVHVLGAVVALVAVGLLLEEARLARPAFDWILPRRPSQNVIAEMPEDSVTPEAGAMPRGARATGGAGRTRPVVLVVAHYDTQRGSWLFAPWFRPVLPLFFKAAYGAVGLAMVGLVAAALAGWLWPGWGGWRWAAGAGGILTALLMGFLALAGLTGRPVNGANDNGSGTAVVLALAERWARRPARGAVELRFVFTGAEEAGTRGMWAYLRSLELSRDRPVYVVNVDNVGGGKLRVLLNEGMLLPVPCGTRLRRLAKGLVGEGRLTFWPRMLLLSTDAGPAAVRGHEVITFIGLDDQGNISNYHWFSDMIHHVDRHHLEQVCETVSVFVERLVSELSVPYRPGFEG